MAGQWGLCSLGLWCVAWLGRMKSRADYESSYWHGVLSDLFVTSVQLRTEASRELGPLALAALNLARAASLRDLNSGNLQIGLNHG